MTLIKGGVVVACVVALLAVTGCGDSEDTPNERTIVSQTADPRFADKPLGQSRLQQLCKSSLDAAIAASKTESSSNVDTAVPERQRPVYCGVGPEEITAPAGTDWTVDGQSDVFFGTHAYFAVDEGPAVRSTFDLPPELTEDSCADGSLSDRVKYSLDDAQGTSVEEYEDQAYCLLWTNSSDAQSTQSWQAIQAVYFDRQTTVEVRAVASWYTGYEDNNTGKDIYEKVPKIDEKLFTMLDAMLETAVTAFREK